MELQEVNQKKNIDLIKHIINLEAIWIVPSKAVQLFLHEIQSLPDRWDSQQTLVKQTYRKKKSYC